MCGGVCTPKVGAAYCFTAAEKTVSDPHLVFERPAQECVRVPPSSCFSSTKFHTRVLEMKARHHKNSIFVDSSAPLQGFLIWHLRFVMAAAPTGLGHADRKFEPPTHFGRGHIRPGTQQMYQDTPQVSPLGPVVNPRTQLRTVAPASRAAQGWPSQRPPCAIRSAANSPPTTCRSTRSRTWGYGRARARAAALLFPLPLSGARRVGAAGSRPPRREGSGAGRAGARPCGRAAVGAVPAAPRCARAALRPPLCPPQLTAARVCRRCAVRRHRQRGQLLEHGQRKWRCAACTRSPASVRCSSARYGG